MRVSGPQALTVGSANTITDPAQLGGNPSAACQIQNSSPYQLNVLAAGDVLSVQAFTAQTVEISGQPIQVTPLANPTVTGTALVTFVFLLTTAPNTGVQLTDGTWVETPPQQDGPLTAAAIASALSTQGSVDLLYFVSGGLGPALPANTGVLIPPTAVNTNKAYQSVVINISTTAPGGFVAGSITAFAQCFAGEIQFPSQTQTYPASPVDGLSFILPCAYSPTDLLEIILTSTSAQIDMNYAVLGLTEQVVGEVITPMGMPLATYLVGPGAKVASASLPTATSEQLLPAAPAGKVYRLQRYGVSLAQGVAAFTNIPMALTESGGTPLSTDIILTAANATVAAGMVPLYGQVTPGPVNMIQVSGDTLTGILRYDLIPTPTPQ